MTQTTKHPHPPTIAATATTSDRTAKVPVRVMPPMTERNLQSAVEKLARFHGFLVYHTHDSRRSQPGFPDLVMVSARRGRTMFRELKSAAGKLRPDQATWLDELTAAGQDVGIWRPADLVSGRIVAELSAARHDDHG